MSYTSLFTTLVSPFNSRFAPKAALAAGTIGGIISTAALPVKAGLLSYKRLSPVQRVATTPLYFVCNSRGNAYLQEDVQGGNPEQRTVVYFMSYQDADNYMNEMTQSNPSHASEFRIMTVSMEKVLNLIQNKKQSRKMARYEIDMIYRIQPSSQQAQNAEKIAGKQALSEYSIPMFAAEGVAVKRKSGEVITPYYFSYEDLLNDWEKLRESSPKLPASPKVVVKDFTDVMVLADGNTAISFEDKVDDKVIANEGLSVAQIKEALLTPGVVPSRDEIERLRTYYREKGTVKGEFSKAKLFASP
eukprot:CAMPEP_0173144258 /NCGR_PEP_ID=MMETSP1105-20130129/7127_1 /TAXON_ID=2985 /ORGANISM="Ochromonas sp., Strain BG-1" /LENGTH=301 /DNA_ID=CAMNT_0014057907 /DNA_START=516 /DNA_END=1421 /DNA_ORIENTATION=-